jgi:hypothetical protein
MDAKQAKALQIAFEAVLHSLNVPSHLVSDIDDVQLKRMVGSLAAEVTSKIDYEILPHLYKQFPELKMGPGVK